MMAAPTGRLGCLTEEFVSGREIAKLPSRVTSGQNGWAKTRAETASQSPNASKLDPSERESLLRDLKALLGGTDSERGEVREGRALTGAASSLVFAWSAGDALRDRCPVPFSIFFLRCCILLSLQSVQRLGSARFLAFKNGWCS